ncbi:MAG TPA: hypothetical protein VJI32_04585 [Candidatus Nanoarchaeia archaeon]|nr:hypothetical protein [Candidatus Nanoarchaeia archaeon]
MSKQEVKKESRIKTKKKSWFKIVAPAVFGKRELGETYVTSAESAMGRMLKINLKDISGNVKDQNAYIHFRVVNAVGTTLETTALGYELTPSSLKRMVRKNIDRLDEYTALATKDSRKVIVKSIFITVGHTQRSIHSKLRSQLKRLLSEEARKGDFDSFLASVASYRIQSMVKKRLSKIYPLRDFAIRMLALREHEQMIPEELQPQEAEPALGEDAGIEESEEAVPTE